LPVAAACSGILLPAASTAASVTVTVEPPLRADVVFDRDQPPREMPIDAVEGSAVCSNVFEIEAKFASSVEVVSSVAVRVYPETFEIITRFRSTIYLPDGSPEMLEAHEKGHRAIGEHFYGNADLAAREAAMSLVGQPFEGIGNDLAAAELAAGRVVLTVLRDEFMKRTQARSAAANARYDELTEHGQSRRLSRRLRPDTAVAIALEDERHRHAPSTQ
jgi:hypothetical protein